MATRSLVVCALVAAVAARPAVAGERDHALIDKVDVRPSPINGLARVRALVSATELQGARIPQEGKPDLTVKLGGAKIPFAWGVAAQAEVELDVVLVVATTDAFAGSLDAIRDALGAGLLTPAAPARSTGTPGSRRRGRPRGRRPRRSAGARWPRSAGGPTC